MDLRSVVGYDVFISYARGEADVYATDLAAALEQGERPLIVFLDDSELDLFANLAPELKRNIRRSRVLVAIGTPKALISDFVAFEVSCAKAANKRILVINPGDLLEAEGLEAGEVWEPWITKGKPWIDEPLSSGSTSETFEFIKGAPSPTVVQSIKAQIGRIRRKTEANIWIGSLVSIAVIAAVAASIAAVAAIRYTKDVAKLAEEKKGLNDSIGQLAQKVDLDKSTIESDRKVIASTTRSITLYSTDLVAAKADFQREHTNVDRLSGLSANLSQRVKTELNDENRAKGDLLDVRSQRLERFASASAAKLLFASLTEPGANHMRWQHLSDRLEMVPSSALQAAIIAKLPTDFPTGEGGSAAHISPSGLQVFEYSADERGQQRYVRYDLSSGNEVKTEFPRASVAFTQDLSEALVWTPGRKGGADPVQHLELWNRGKRTLLQSMYFTSSTVAVSSDGKRGCIVQQGQSSLNCHILQLPDGKETQSFEVPWPFQDITTLSIEGQEPMVAIGGAKGAAMLWRDHSVVRLSNVVGGQSKRVKLSPDGKLIAIMDPEECYVRDIKDVRRIQGKMPPTYRDGTFHNLRENVVDILFAKTQWFALTRDGCLFASSYDGLPLSRSSVSTQLMNLDAPASGMALSQDESHLVVLSAGAIHRIPIESRGSRTFRVRPSPGGTPDWIPLPASSDSIVSDEKNLYLLKGDGGQERLTTSSAPLLSVRVSPDGRYAVLASIELPDYVIRLVRFDLKLRRLITIPTQPERWRVLGVDNSGKVYLALADPSGTSSKEVLRWYPGHKMETVLRLSDAFDSDATCQFSNDGKWFAIPDCGIVDLTARRLALNAPGTGVFSNDSSKAAWWDGTTLKVIDLRDNNGTVLPWESGIANQPTNGINAPTLIFGTHGTTLAAFAPQTGRVSFLSAANGIWSQEYSRELDVPRGLVLRFRAFGDDFDVLWLSPTDDNGAEVGSMRLPGSTKALAKEYYRRIGANFTVEDAMALSVDNASVKR